jgi:alanine-synthesizing transaminase
MEPNPVKAIFLNFPNNPTGQCVSEDFYRTILKRARRVGVLVVNDFVYGEMTYSGVPAVSLLKAAADGDLALETYSLSKAFSVPGWRVGAVLGSGGLVERISRAKSRVDYGLFLPIQIASAAALSSQEPFVRQITDHYRSRAEVMVKVLRAADWEVRTPDAGASVWAKIPINRREEGSDVVVAELVRHGLIATGESFFGAAREGYVRFALVKSEDRLMQISDLVQL